MSARTPFPLAHRAFARLAGPFVEAGILGLSDVHFADLLGARAGEGDAGTLLAFAFAARAPRHGHVGVDLLSVRETATAEVPPRAPAEGPAPEPVWPDDPEAWRDRAARSPLAGAPGEEPRPFVFDGRLIVPRRYWDYQEALRAALLARACAADLPADEASLASQVSALFGGAPEPGDEEDPQREGAVAAVRRPFSVLTGGPGTGKTYTVKKVLALLRADIRGRLGREPRIALAAPTGKAAVRMAQAIGEGLEALPVDDATRTWLRGLAPSTLHALLGPDPGRPTRFRHDASRPLPHDAVIVDEASMVDLALMTKLVQAVRPTSRLVLLGDRNQLASVEAGSVLADLTRAAERPGSPLARSVVGFTRPRRFREGSGLQRVAWAIAKGDPESLDLAVRWLAGDAAGGEGPFPDLHHVPHTPEGHLAPEALAVAVEGARAWLDLLVAGPASEAPEYAAAHHAEVLRLLDASRVLTPHRRGPLGVLGLNALVRDALVRSPGSAAGGALDPSLPFPAGRPVLVTENRSSVGRMNGDVGVVVPVPGGAVRVAFPGTLPGAVDLVDPARLPAVETAFAMTIHKSQGSQIAHPLVVLPAAASRLLTRELVYTALTRASREVTVAGDLDLLRAALDRRVERASSLESLLAGDA